MLCPRSVPFQVYVHLTYQTISQMDLIFVNSFRSGMLFYCLEYRHLVSYQLLFVCLLLLLLLLFCSKWDVGIGLPQPRAQAPSSVLPLLIRTSPYPPTTHPSHGWINIFTQMPAPLSYAWLCMPWHEYIAFKNKTHSLVWPIWTLFNVGLPCMGSED